jgi:DNA primase
LEGQLDLITAFEAGIQNVAAPQGTALTERHATLLRRFCDEVILFFDSDQAGEKAAERALEVLYGAGLQVRIGELPAGDDPDSLIRREGGALFQQRVADSPDFFDYQMNRNLSAAGSRTTAARVAFARKVSRFVSFVPDAILRETLISRLATRLTLPRETLEQMVRASTHSGQAKTQTVSDQVVHQGESTTRHDLAVVCKALLTDPILLQQVRRQPWGAALRYIDDSELVRQILDSEFEADQPSSIAVFLGSLSNADASTVSRLLANKDLNERMGLIYWTKLVATALHRRKVQLEHILRLTSDGSDTHTQTKSELKEVLDLESRITDISRLSSRVTNTEDTFE